MREGREMEGVRDGRVVARPQYFCLQPPLQPPNERGNLGLVCM